jgi:hypothetical protein
MIKKGLLGFLLLVVVTLSWFQVVGMGWLGGPWQSAPATTGPRAQATAVAAPQILFGDLHTHTNYSLDAYVFSSNLVKGGGVMTPADACDFARYCSALDFWSINDHAESLTPRVWADTVASTRLCNAMAGPQDNPDMVSFLGWEWSNNNRDDIPSHYGHKNVVLRTWEEGTVPTRPIASKEDYVMGRAPALLFGLLSWFDGLEFAADLGWYVDEVMATPICADGVASDELPADCREVALTPSSLYRKLDEWGFDAMVIPHGLAWGTTNPLTGDFQDQMDEHEQRYQNLLEMFSGHGSSERFEDFQRIAEDETGQAYCPPASENFMPCCQQAGVIVGRRCDDPASAQCEQKVTTAMAAFVAKGAPAGRKTLADTTLDDWEGCGQLQNTFQPSSMYVPRLSAQYSLALGFDEAGAPKRAKFGLMGSSDGHQARPGSSYKETNRVRFTDNKDVGERMFSASALKADSESGSFYYTGGLVAAHTDGRDRDSIWQALSNRNVYATSGDRMLVWFDLLNGPSGEVPMGSEVRMEDVPRFRVKALGALEQLAGCPDYAVAALGEERIASLCQGECYQPGNRRKAISRIEIVRIRPQVSPDESIAPLIENSWRVFECPASGEGCTVEFEDADYSIAQRPALYYARVIQAAEPLIGGDPFGCEYNEQGECIRRNYCIGANATPDNNCLAEAEPRAWTSPIFVEPPLGNQP